MKRDTKDATISPFIGKSCFNEQKTFCSKEKEGFGETCRKEVERFKIPAAVLKLIEKSKTLPVKELATEVLKSDEFADLRSSSTIQIKGGLAVMAMASLVILVSYGLYRFCNQKNKGVKGYTVVIPKT